MHSQQRLDLGNDRTLERGGLQCVAPSQLAVDVLTDRVGYPLRARRCWREMGRATGMSGGPDTVCVGVRTVLVDADDGLTEQLDTLVLVGAQAMCFRPPAFSAGLVAQADGGRGVTEAAVEQWTRELTNLGGAFLVRHRAGEVQQAAVRARRGAGSRSHRPYFSRRKFCSGGGHASTISCQSKK